jgi:hypothetical protein
MALATSVPARVRINNDASCSAWLWPSQIGDEGLWRTGLRFVGCRAPRRVSPETVMGRSEAGHARSAARLGGGIGGAVGPPARVVHAAPSMGSVTSLRNRRFRLFRSFAPVSPRTRPMIPFVTAGVVPTVRPSSGFH